MVIDATANGVATRLLLDAGEALKRPVVSVCLVRNGQVARVEILGEKIEIGLRANPEAQPGGSGSRGSIGQPSASG